MILISVTDTPHLHTQVAIRFIFGAIALVAILLLSHAEVRRSIQKTMERNGKAWEYTGRSINNITVSRTFR
jgi:hypothetical protein